MPGNRRDRSSKNTTIDCNHVAGSIGVFSDRVQELGGFRNVSIVNYKAIGIAVLDQFNLSPGTGFAREGYIQVGSLAKQSIPLTSEIQS